MTKPNTRGRQPMNPLASRVLNPLAPNMEAATNLLLEDDNVQIVEREVIREVVPDNAIVALGDGAFQYHQFTLNPTSLDIPDNTTQDDWAELGVVIRGLESAVSWHIGDWAAFANAVWEISYEQIAEHFGYEIDTLKTYAWVARQIPRSIRNRPLSFSHHRLVAPLDDSEKAYWLETAAQNGWKVSELRAALRPDRPTPRPIDDAIRRVNRDFARYKALPPADRMQLAQVYRDIADKLAKG